MDEKNELKCVKCGKWAKPNSFRIEGFKVRGWKCKQCGEGYLHPEDRIISYLKYVPNITGKWKLNLPESQGDGKKRIIPLMRVLNHYSAEQVLKSYDILLYDYLKYVYDCPISKIKITAVPYEAIKEYYKPQKRIEQLYNLHKKNKLDNLQRKTIEFIDFLSENSQIKTSNFGITGSIVKIDSLDNLRKSTVNLFQRPHESSGIMNFY